MLSQPIVSSTDSRWVLIMVQSRGGAGFDARWPEVVAARNAEVQKLTGQVQAALAREAGLVQQTSVAQQAHRSLQVTTCWLPLSRCSFSDACQCTMLSQQMSISQNFQPASTTLILTAGSSLTGPQSVTQ